MMAIYKCEKCGSEKEIRKVTIIFIDGSWNAKESLCEKCEIYMDSKPTDGIPSLIRTESSLTKNR